MTENEIKAIKWIKNVRDDAVITLDHIQKNEPNVSPMLYAGRKKKAETIMEMCEELEQYRAIGTVEDIQEVMALCKSLQETTCKYMDIGTVEEFKALKDINRIADNLSKMERIEFKALKEKNEPKKPYIQQIVKDFREHDCYECPNCDCFVGYVSECQEEHYQDIYCPNCGQKLDWQ